MVDEALEGIEIINTFLSFKDEEDEEDIPLVRQLSAPAILSHNSVESDCPKRRADEPTEAEQEPHYSCATGKIDYDRFPWLRPKPSILVSKALSKDELEQWKGVTTVMMRNLPNKYQRGMMRREIDNNGFKNKYDFFYLPIDQETNANRGYAFINFVEPAHALAFKIRYDGNKLSNYNSKKVLAVTVAQLQGFQANHVHYSKARVTLGPDHTRPLFLREMSKEEAEQAEMSAMMPKRPTHPQSQFQCEGQLGTPDEATPLQHSCEVHAKLELVTPPSQHPCEVHAKLQLVTPPPTPPPSQHPCEVHAKLGMVTYPPPPPASPPKVDWVPNRVPSGPARYCPYCGKYIADASHRFCVSCGNHLVSEQPGNHVQWVMVAPAR